ncbi:MAG: hypothetical protein J4215_01145 [Candidatus Diapherotrites archaeon]|uniref:Uncharacterized protein n=1 Tax=Candidatus Iainarchaeum sp. TaxID=3101447 RepID=A0A8T4L8S8_9ARCH|nr:hypothetical protein [Candidatus Diapherotrites archaeon]
MISSKAQVSLEFLLVFAAFLGVLGLFAPLISQLYSKSVFGLDVLEGRRFSDDFLFRASELALMGDESAFLVAARPKNPWFLSVRENLFVLSIKSSSGFEHEFIRTLPIRCEPFSASFDSPVFFRLLREKNSIVIDADSDS